MNHHKIIKVATLDVVEGVREAEVKLKEVTSEIILKETQISTSSVAVVESYIPPECAAARCGAQDARQIGMDRARASRYRNPRTMAWSFHIPPGGPLQNVWQFHLPPHTLDFLQV